MKQVVVGGSTDIKRHGTKFSRADGPAGGIFALYRSGMHYGTKCRVFELLHIAGTYTYTLICCKGL